MRKTRKARFIDGAALAARTVSVLVLANAPLLAATPPPAAADPWTRGLPFAHKSRWTHLLIELATLA